MARANDKDIRSKLWDILLENEKDKKLTKSAVMRRLAEILGQAYVVEKGN